jgi:hypothetical protein
MNPSPQKAERDQSAIKLTQLKTYNILLFHLFAQTPQKSWFMVLERVIKLL